MRILLDTHTLLWFYMGDVQLSSAARAAISDPGNDKLVSPASYWELAIKVSRGNYILMEPYDEFIQHALIDNGFAILPIEPRHTSALIALPYHHKDPFDRLLIAQGLVEAMPIVSTDPKLDLYSIKRLW